MNHRLHASHLTLGYDHKIIANDLSVAILYGAFTVIVGPNACGKSTLLRALCSLLKPSAGEVFIDGKSISRPPRRWLASWAYCRKPQLRRTVLPWRRWFPVGVTHTKAC